MINELKINQIVNQPAKQEEKISKRKITFKGNEDSFVKENELSKEVKTSLASFIYNCDFKQVVNDLIKKNNFGGMTTIAANYDRNNNLSDMSYIEFDIFEGESQVHSVNLQDFLDIVQFVMYKKLSEHPENDKEYNNLYAQLANKLLNNSKQ